MTKLKVTQRGKSGKHESQRTAGSFKAMALRIGRQSNATDRVLLAQLLRGKDADEPGGLLAGKHQA